MSVIRTEPLAPAGDEREAVSQLTGLEPHYNVAIGYLRAFVTVLVVTHHAVVAYIPAAPAPAASLILQPRLWHIFPVVDARQDRQMSPAQNGSPAASRLSTKFRKFCYSA